VIISDQKTGPFRVVLEAQGGALALFSPQHRTTVMRRIMKRTGNHFLFKWIPARFSGYAYKLGYRVSNKWRRLKERMLTGVVPYVGMTPSGGGNPGGPWWQRNKAKMVDAVQKGRVSATGSGTDVAAVIRIPYGHPIQTDKAAIFRTIAPNEIEDMAGVFAQALASEIAGARASVKDGTPRLMPRVPKRKTADRPPRKVA
jgi:hypothetical protein